MKAPVEHGKYYHIFNRGNNYDNIFINPEDYEHFLSIYKIYINPIAETYAWCLMKNHFHLLVRIKDENEIGYLSAKNAKNENPEIKWKTYNVEHVGGEYIKKPNPTQQFKHLFNAYARWFNIRHNRISSLFEKNFERKMINTKKQLINLILYIHNNPVKHGFTQSLIEYPWTSYFSIVDNSVTFEKKDEVIQYFNDIDNFKVVHSQHSAKYENQITELLFE